MRFFWPLFCVLVLVQTALAVAQTQEAVPPALGQPENFSHLVGRFSFTISAAPTAAFVEEPILLKVVIHAESELPNKDYLPERQHLKIITGEMQQNFFIAAPPDKPDEYDPKTKTWVFYYRLQPKYEQVTGIPALELMFYNPQVPPDFRYQPVTSAAIPLKVKARPQVIVAPDAMYHLASGDNLLRRADESSVNWWLIVLGLILPPAASLMAYRLWRYHHPDRARRRRQSRAARQALRALRLLPTDPHGRGSGAVFTRFLQTRMSLPSAEPTPLEVRLHLWQQGFSPQLTDSAGNFYQIAAEAQFAPVGDRVSDDRRKEAMRLILAVEEEHR